VGSSCPRTTNWPLSGRGLGYVTQCRNFGILSIFRTFKNRQKISHRPKSFVWAYITCMQSFIKNRTKTVAGVAIWKKVWRSGCNSAAEITKEATRPRGWRMISGLQLYFRHRDHDLWPCDPKGWSLHAFSPQTPCANRPMHQNRCIRFYRVMRIHSVDYAVARCKPMSVRLSVSKRLNILSNFFRRQLATPF